MNSFADRLHSLIEKNSSCLIAGFDPVIESFPKFFLSSIARSAATNEEAIKSALVKFHKIALEEVHPSIAGVKINTAFFEQYGLAGISAMQTVADDVKNAGLILIVDAKRGDIGSTAQAYSNAFLGRADAFGKKLSLVDGDALTVNPFLGFDTLQAFIDDAADNGKGIFILVKTSNSGSAAIQGVKDDSGRSISEKIAEWVANKADVLRGQCGYSGLGAVVAATYPEEAKALREMMPTSLFLMPGFAAQGGTADDALSGFAVSKSSSKFKRGGAVINISRGLLGHIPEGVDNEEELRILLRARIQKYNEDLSAKLK